MSTITTTFAYEEKGFAAIAAKLDVLRGRVEKPLGGLKKLNQAGSDLMEAFSPLAPIAIGVGAAIAGVGVTAAAIGVGIKKAFDMGGELSDLSARTGAAIGDLMVLRQAFDNAGIGAEAVGPSINKMQKALAGLNEDGEPTNKVFAQLGLNMEELKGLSATEQFDAIGKAIGGLEDPAQRSMAAMGLFGKSGGQMLALFTDSGALGDAAKDIGNQAALMEENAALFDKISDILGTTGTKLQGFFVGMGAELAPIIEPLVDLFRNTDFSGFGQQLGRSIAIAFQALTDGSIWKLAADGALIGIGEAVNFLWKGLSSAISGAGEMLIQSFKNAATYFEVLTTPGFWEGMSKSLLGIAAQFGAMLLDKIADLVEAIAGIPVIGDAVGKNAGRALRDQATAARESGQQFVGEGFDALAPAGKVIAARQVEQAKALNQAITKAFNETGSIVDVSALVEEFTNGIDDQKSKLDFARVRALAANPNKEKGSQLDLSGGTDKKGSGVSKLVAIGGFGVFVRDPMIVEARRTNDLLLKIEKNTTPNKNESSTPNFDARFA